MTDNIITIVYILGYLFTFRYIVRAVAWADYNPNRSIASPEAEDWFFAVFIGFFASIAWPIALVIAFALAHPNTFHVAFGTPAKVKQAERERALKERERAVARLERELGIGKTERSRHVGHVGDGVIYSADGRREYT